jgi:MFS family permease
MEPVEGPQRVGYFAVLRGNPQFALAFAGEAVTQSGNWFSYMAMLTVVQRLSAGENSSLLVSALILCRLLPSTVLAPVMGSIADSSDKRRGLVAVSLVAASCSLLMCLVRTTAALPALFLLIVLQSAATAQYDPFRRALIPLLVPHYHLQQAATLDGMLWSVCLSVGASLGGLAVEWLGTTACFLLDAASFVVSAFLWAALAPTPPPAVAADAVSVSMGAKGMEMVRELVAYLRRDKHVLLLCALKAMGASIWGAADVMNVRYAALPQMQQIGGDALTMGIIFASVGVGCVIGPLVTDAVTVQSETPLLRACVVSMGIVAGSFGLLAGAASARAAGLSLVLLATGLRSCGSSTLWVYSTLLIQLRCDQRMLGRLFAFEQALQTAGSAFAGVIAGAVSDAGLSSALLSAALLLVGSIETLALVVYFKSHIGSGNSGDSEYEMLLEATELEVLTNGETSRSKSAENSVPACDAAVLQ